MTVKLGLFTDDRNLSHEQKNYNLITCKDQI